MIVLKKIIAVFFIFLTFVALLSIPVSAAGETDSMPYDSYTYWSGLGGGGRTAVQIKPMYQVEKVIYDKQMNVGTIEAFEDICCGSDGLIYILEGKNSKIIVLNTDLTTKYVISEIKDTNGKTISFKGSEGIFVDKYNNIYIAASEQQIVFKIDSQGNLIKQYLLPDSNIIPSNFRYRPIKVTVDSKGYVYILSEGSYYGALLYSPTDEFLGFYGANSVASTITDVFQNLYQKLLMNDIKKEQSLKKLPYQFTDLVVDEENFIYTTTGTTVAGAKGQIRRLNPGGKNVLDSSGTNYADENASIKIGNGWHGTNLSRIAVFGDFIYALDTSYGKVFMYNTKNELIGVFGGGLNTGEQKGSFMGAKAIEVYNGTVYVIDAKKNCLTVFTPTEYGKLVMSASSKVIRSEYLEAEAEWESIITQDANNQLAYRYLAKAEYTKGNYKKAMNYAKLGADRDTYGQVYEVYRNRLLKSNFVYIVIATVVVIALVAVLFYFKKKKRIVLFKNEKFKLMLSTPLHPFNTYNEIKYKNKGSVLLAAVLVAIYFVTEILTTTNGGFLYTYFNAATFNSLFILLRTIGIVFLWTFTNWAVSTLFGGIGKVKEIFVVVGYSLTPLIIGNLTNVIATNVLVPSEAQFLDVLMKILMAYTLILISIGTIVVHDFDFGHFVLTTLLTLVGIVIVVFVIFIAWLIIQQLFGFVLTLFNEIIYR